MHVTHPTHLTHSTHLTYSTHLTRSTHATYYSPAVEVFAAAGLRISFWTRQFNSSAT